MFERQQTLGTDGTVVATIAPDAEASVNQENQQVQAFVIQGSLPDAWGRVRRRLRAELGEDVFSSWFGRVEIASVTDGVAYLTVPTRFLKSWLEAHYAERLMVNCQAELGADNGVVISVRQVAREAVPVPLREVASSQGVKSAGPTAAAVSVASRAGATAPAAAAEADLVDACGTVLDRRMTFSSFIVGKSNQLAFAAAERIAALVAAVLSVVTARVTPRLGAGSTEVEALDLGALEIVFTTCHESSGRLGSSRGP